MGQTIISAVGVYISTSIDYLIILIILFAQLSQNKQKWHIYAGQYLGTGLLVGASLVAACNCWRRCGRRRGRNY